MAGKRQSQSTMRTSARAGSSLWLTFLLLTAAVLSCRSGSSVQKCSATLTYEGRTFVGEDTSTERAKHNACNKYCRDADPGYEAMYGVWLDSPAGQAAGRPSEEAIFKEKKLMDYVTVTCANECLAKIKDGKLKVDTKCD